MTSSSFRIAASAALIVAGLAATRAQEQPAAPPAAPATPPAAAAATPKVSGPKDSVTVVETKVLGASIATLQFVDAGASDDGHRTQFDAIPSGTAFEVWLEGLTPRKVYVTEPGATQPVQKPCVAVLRVSDAEWDDYVAFLTKDVPPGGDLATFLTAVLNTMLEQKSYLLYYRDSLDSIAQRAAPALQKLERGTPFVKVVRVHSEDQGSANADGLFVDDTRGNMMDLYPFGKVIFEMQPGQLVGPVFNKNAAYLIHLEKVEKSNNPRFDKARASGIVIKYTTGPAMSSRDSGAVSLAARVRSDEERFQKLLPPGLQVPSPKSFGPDDIAPRGKPEQPLKRIGVGQ